MKDFQTILKFIFGYVLQVNPQWSMDLAAKIPIIEVNTRVVACDGGGGALGHPR